MADPLRILIADDDAALLQVLTEALQLAGHIPTQAGTVSDLLTALRGAATFDLILTDMFAADYSEISTTLRELRDATGDTPILLITGWAEIENEAPRLAATDILVKPFSLDQLLERIDSLVHRPTASNDV